MYPSTETASALKTSLMTADPLSEFLQETLRT
jgi:hypothetical protein